MRHRATMAAVAAGVLLLGGTAACSSGGTPAPSPTPSPTASPTPNGVERLDAEQILERTSVAANAAESVKVKATTAAQTGEAVLEMSLTKTGSQGKQSGTNQLEIIASDGTLYLKGDQTFNEAVAGPTRAPELEGKWVSVPANDPQASSFSSLTSSTAFFTSLLRAEGDPKKVAPKEVDGVRCVGLQSQAGTLWVSTIGEPYPVAVEARQAGQGRVTLSDWNAAVTITPPPADQVIPASELQPATPPPGSSAPGSPSPTAS